jgi:serine/threonine protein kinase
MLENEFTTIDDIYQLIKQIGVGASCKVYLARVVTEEIYVAIKVIKHSKELHSKEIETLSKINSQGVISIYRGGRGLKKKPDGRTKMVDFIVLEYAMNGELLDYILFTGQGFGEKMGRVIFKQIISGIEGCHRTGIVHRDLKLENLLVDEFFKIKIADFGFATIINKYKSGYLITQKGTKKYAAPEILAGQPYIGTCVDVFSAGVILFILVTGASPVLANADYSDPCYKYIMKNNYDQFWNYFEGSVINTSEEFKSLINLMIAFDPVQRPTTLEIINHPWMTVNNCTVTNEEYAEEFERRKSIIVKRKEIGLKDQVKKRISQKQGVFRSDSLQEIEFTDYFKDNTPIDVVEYNKSVNNPYKFIIRGSDSANYLNLMMNYFMRVDKREKTMIRHETKARFKVHFDHANIKVIMDEIDSEYEEGQDKCFLVECMRTNGDKMEFHDIYKDFLTFIEKQKI